MVAGIGTPTPIFAGPPLPPEPAVPQVMTEPSAFNAAKADPVE